MKSHFIQNEFAYDGSQLRSLFAYLGHGIQGTSIISWIGACDISNEHMIDGEDLLAGETIAGARMVHFIIERFETQLFGAVALQRLMASIVMDICREHVGAGASGSAEMASIFRREGDDVYFGDGKLSISIATLTPISALIHFAVNVNNDGTPVKTAALSDFGFDAETFAHRVMGHVVREVESIEIATVKVRWAK
jgi:hypothetical protein